MGLWTRAIGYSRVIDTFQKVKIKVFTHIFLPRYIGLTRLGGFFFFLDFGGGFSKIWVAFLIVTIAFSKNKEKS